jgi:hypothetical protein
MSILKGSGGAGGSYSDYSASGGAGGGAGGGSVALISEGDVLMDGDITATGGGGGLGDYFWAPYNSAQCGGGGAGGGILVSGTNVSLSGTLDARGRLGNNLSTVNGGTVKVFSETSRDNSATILAGRRYISCKPVMQGLILPPDNGMADLRTAFHWRNGSDPDGDTLTYQLQVSDGPGFANLLLNVEWIKELAYTSTRDLYGKPLCWRVRANDGVSYGAWSGTWTFFTDVNPPVTHIEALTEYTTAAHFKVFWQGTDDISGICAFYVYVSDNGGPFELWMNGTSKLSEGFPGKDGHRYGFCSAGRDRCGNIESVHASADAATTVDATPPVSGMVAVPACVNTGAFKVGWSATDEVSGVRVYHVFAADGDAPPGPWIWNVTVTSALFQGVDGHEYSFFSIACDNAGNREQEPPPSMWAHAKVDKDAPATSVVVGTPSFGKDPVFVTAATPISLEGTDEFSGICQVNYSIDDGPARKYLGPVKESASGPHSMMFWSVDNAGNIGNAGRLSFFVDGDGPKTGIYFAGPNLTAAGGTFISGDTSIAIEAEDNGSGVDYIEYSQDLKGYQRYFGPFRVGKTGIHSISYRGVDRVGNMGDVGDIKIIVDAEPPRTRVDGDYPRISNKDINISLAASDTESGVAWTVFRVGREGVMPAEYQAGMEILIGTSEDHSNDGNYTVQYFSVDNVDNSEHAKEIHVRMDTRVFLNLSYPATLTVSESHYLMKGFTEPGARLSMGDKEVPVSADGSFEQELELVLGRNKVVVAVEDTAGNTFVRTVYIDYYRPILAEGWFQAVLVLVIVVGIAVAVVIVIKRKTAIR